MRNISQQTWYRAALVALVLLAGVLRFCALDDRPLHHDEGVNTLFMSRLLADGVYRYDPQNYHGPLLYYMTWVPLSVFGLQNSWFPSQDLALRDIAFRLVPALLGTLMVALIPALRQWLGRGGVLFSMALLALSPAFLYYSRDNIHEIYLLTFTLTAFVAGWRYFTTDKPRYLVLTLASVGFMFTVKETAIMTCAAWVSALALSWWIHAAVDARLGFGGREGLTTGRWWASRQVLIPAAIAVIMGGFLLLARRPVLGEFTVAFKGALMVAVLTLLALWLPRVRRHALHVFLGSLLLLLILAVFFSSFFTHPEGMSNFFVAFENWVSTGTEHSAHTKPLTYYILLLFSFETAIVLLGVLGIVFGLARSQPTTTFTALWALQIGAIYSLVPYKTPWLALNVALPLVLLAGRFVQVLLACDAGRMVRVGRNVLLILILARSAYAAVDLAFFHYDDSSRPLIYVQSYRDVRDLLTRIEQVAAKWSGTGTEIVVTSSDYWPLPWYLRDFNRVLWHGRMVEKLDAPMVLASSKQQEELDRKLGAGYQRESYRLRPGASLVLYSRSGEGDPTVVTHLAAAKKETVPAEQMKPGLRARVFSGRRFEGRPVDERIDTRIDFTYNNEQEKPYKAPFSILWSGFLRISEAGEYILITESDDGSWIYLDGTLVVDNGGEHGMRRAEKRLSLEAGDHSIEIRYFDQYFGAIMRVKWLPPGGRETLLTGEHLFHVPE